MKREVSLVGVIAVKLGENHEKTIVLSFIKFSPLLGIATMPFAVTYMESMLSPAIRMDPWQEISPLLILEMYILTVSIL